MFEPTLSSTRCGNHGVVKGDNGIGDAHVGDIVAIRPNHVCSVVNLFDEYAITDDAGYAQSDGSYRQEVLIHN